MKFHPTRIKFLRAILSSAISFIRPEVLKIRHGFTLKIPKTDQSPYIDFLFFKGEYEKEETSLIKRILKAGDIAIDVGANVGYHTCLMSRCVGDSGKIFSFEPENSNFLVLEENIDLNKINNVVLLNIALGEKEKKETMYISPENKGDHTLVPMDRREPVNIDVTTFNAFYRNNLKHLNVALIKIDVQGYELQVLEGMKDNLKQKTIDNMIVEFTPERVKMAGRNPHDFLDIIRDNFSGFNIINSTIEDCLTTDRLKEKLDVYMKNEFASFSLHLYR